MINNVNVTLSKIDGKHEGKSVKKWVLRLSYYEDGKRKTSTRKTGLLVKKKGSKQQAEEMAKELQNEFMKKYNSSGARWYMHEWIEHWYKEVKSKKIGKSRKQGGITKQTYDSYAFQISRIVKYFENHPIKLEDVKAKTLEDFYEYEYEQELNPNTICKDHSTINMALKSACALEVISRNVAQFVEAPKKEKYQPQEPYSTDELKVLLELVKGTDLEVPVYLGSMLGLRKSEALGLKWDCINFTDKVITIKRTATFIDGKQVVIESTKNDSSKRTFTLDSKWEAYLKSVKKKQNLNKMKSGGSFNKDNLVCIDALGDPINLRDLSRVFKKFLEDNNLRVIRFHDLRHSAASLLYSMNKDIKQISTFLGHSNTSTTADIYTHLFNDSKDEMTMAMSSFINVV